MKLKEIVSVPCTPTHCCVPTVLLCFVPVQLGCSGVGKKTPSAHDSSNGGVGGRQRGVVIARPLCLHFEQRGDWCQVDGVRWMYATTALLMSVQCHTL